MKQWMSGTKPLVTRLVTKQQSATRWLIAALGLMLFACSAVYAQTGGEGGIQGTVTDSTGAVIPKATVTVTNMETKVSTTTTATGDGLYTVSPIIPGNYSVRVTAEGFGTYTQENLRVDALKLTGLNMSLKAGANSEITITDSPAALETTNATLGGVIENETYSNLPLQMSGQQRDVTAFATLLPGAQSGARAPIIGGTANYSTELYLDGLPVTIATQQGDNRVIFNSVPVEAVNQFQVLTSSIPAQYQGAGVLNFTIKSGTDQYHGSANMYFRNTVLDTWTYTSKAATYTDASGVVRPARKPYENQNEIAATVGGPIPFTHKKGFFSFTYDRFHGRNGVNPGLLTVPTTRMRNGDFSELLTANGGPGYTLYDPTTQAECTSHKTTPGPCRYAYGQSYSGTPSPTGGATGTATNIIPANQISSIARKMQSFLPAPSNGNLQNNYLGGLPSGFDNWSYVWRADYQITPSQKISFVNTKGSRLNVPYTFAANPTLPVPYGRVTKARVVINIAGVEHDWTVRPWLVNQFKIGFLQMGGPPIQNATDGVAGYQAGADFGITNLPAGQAANEFPSATFSGSFAPTQWANGASGATQSSVSNAYTYQDNVLIVRGKHSITVGAQLQFLQANAAAANGPSGVLNTTYDSVATANPASNSTLTANTGYSYASYLLGGVGSSSTTIQSFGLTGGRYRPFAAYAQDDIKLTPKLTVNVGLRWDYLPPYREVQDRWSFLNPDLTNTATGNKGMLQFAGNRGGGISCNCRTPVQTYWKNFGPRVGFAYAITDKTVIRGGYGVSYSHGGGVGGRAGSFNGTGSLGFSTNPSFTDAGSISPAFYLNDSTAFAAAGLANTSFGGPGYVLPTPPGATATAQLLNTGNYLNGTAAVTPGGVSYADPYVSGRAPVFNFFNAGFQHSLNNHLTVSVNYAGSTSHFLLTGASNARGYWANQLNPTYLASLGGVYAGNSPILTARATSANVAVAQAANAGVTVPYAGFVAAANAGASQTTIQQMLVAFPQYSGVTDLWGQNVGNNSYNSLQVSLQAREWHGTSFQVNYTYAKNLGDDGTFRSGYDIPSGAINANGKSFRRGSADRSWTTISIPQNLAIFGTVQSPFSKGRAFGNNAWTRAIGGGWLLSSIFRYASGTPLAITSAGCLSLAGTCMPDLNVNFAGYNAKNARIGKWGDGATGANPGGTTKIDSNAFVAPPTYAPASVCATTIPNPNGTGTIANPNARACIGMIGNAPRTRAYDLSNPSYYNLDMAIKREFPLTKERFKLQLEADCINVTNKHVFGGIGTQLAAASTSLATYGSFGATNGTSSAFGRPTTANGNRTWQLAGHINF